jgi:arylsulfatase A-like enzyme
MPQNRIMESSEGFEQRGRRRPAAAAVLSFFPPVDLLAAGLTFTACSSQPPPASRPDASVLLISIDTLRADHLGCYGYERDTSPFIDAFARQGVLFANAVTPRPKTGPALASLLTGSYPFRHSVRRNGTPLREQRSLPGLLGGEGYVTAAFVSNHVLKPELSGFQFLFDLYDYEFTRTELNRPDDLQRNAAETNEKVFPWLEEHGDSQFFLWVHYMDPHGPYRPPEEHRSTFSHEERNPRPAAFVPPYQILPEAYREGALTDMEDYVDQYDNEICYADFQIRNLLRKVAELGLDDRTLVILTSDHGENLGQHDYYFDHGRELYEDSSRVPLIMRFPGDAHGGAREGPLVSLLDIFPTVLAFLGIAGGEGEAGDGVSLLAGESKVRDEVFVERYRSGRFDKLAARTSDVKLILTQDREECYDLREDPRELDPGGCGDEIFRLLFHRLEEFSATAREEFRPAPAAVPDKRDLEILRSLGYVE